jgi:hypothetical protein
MLLASFISGLCHWVRYEGEGQYQAISRWSQPLYQGLQKVSDSVGRAPLQIWCRPLLVPTGGFKNSPSIIANFQDSFEISLIQQKCKGIECWTCVKEMSCLPSLPGPIHRAKVGITRPQWCPTAVVHIACRKTRQTSLQSIIPKDVVTSLLSDEHSGEFSSKILISRTLHWCTKSLQNKCCSVLFWDEH